MVKLKNVLAGLLGVSALATMVAVTAPTASADRGGDDRFELRIKTDNDFDDLNRLKVSGLEGLGLTGINKVSTTEIDHLVSMVTHMLKMHGVPADQAMNISDSLRSSLLTSDVDFRVKID